MNLLQAGRIIGLVVPAVALLLQAPGAFAHHHRSQSHHRNDDHNNVLNDASHRPFVTCGPFGGALLYVATPEVYGLSNQ